jgi:hypothetical protein
MGVAIATRQITLDKFGSETSPFKEKVIPPTAMNAAIWYASLNRDAIALRISAKERQSFSATDCTGRERVAGLGKKRWIDARSFAV